MWNRIQTSESRGCTEVRADRRDGRRADGLWKSLIFLPFADYSFESGFATPLRSRTARSDHFQVGERCTRPRESGWENKTRFQETWFSSQKCFLGFTYTKLTGKETFKYRKWKCIFILQLNEVFIIIIVHIWFVTKCKNIT